MGKTCFVSYEIYPTTAGGVGVLIHNAATVLLEQDQDVIFLFDFPIEEFVYFNTVERLKYPNSDHCRAYHVDTLCNDIGCTGEDFASVFEWKSYRFYFAACKIVEQENLDTIEFFDYCGSAHYSLCAKIAGLAFRDTRIVIRLHTTIEVLDRHDATRELNLAEIIMYSLEHHSLRLAEDVLYPSKSFLEENYKPLYEPWFGEVFSSPPPVIKHPNRDKEDPQANIVLFYGRLFSMKGVDAFVDAATLYLSEPGNPPVQFMLIGYDSKRPPIPVDTYQAYLERKIPSVYRDQFVFKGQLNWEQLEAVLPNVLFAVFPNYFESFCYAAHELYSAGIPLLVSSIPTFRDYFSDGENALIFNGTVSELSKKMKQLIMDRKLRHKIMRPYAIDDHSLGDYYSHSTRESWMQHNHVNDRSSDLLICVLCTRGQDVSNKAVFTQIFNKELNHKAIFLKPAIDDTTQGAWFLGGFWIAEDIDGDAVTLSEVTTTDTFLLLRAEDRVNIEYINKSMYVLSRYQEISFVNCWKYNKISTGERKLSTFPVDTIPELMPFVTKECISRSIFRTPVGLSLIDLFDPHSGAWGEAAYIRTLNNDHQQGITIPEPFIETIDNPQELGTGLLTYFINSNESDQQTRRFAQFLIHILQKTDDCWRTDVETPPIQEDQFRQSNIRNRWQKVKRKLNKILHSI